MTSDSGATRPDTDYARHIQEALHELHPDVPTSQLDFSCCIQYTRRLTAIDVLTLEGGGHHNVATTQSAQRRAQPLSEPANRAGVA